jgi:23S rRNA (adenine2030-N6)-methyltransferase
MNYRHIFHAGNAADVVKHLVLVEVLRHLLAKPAPLAVLDTHAGIGRYDLEAPEAQRTGEADAGIRALLRAAELAPPLRAYAGLIRTLNPDGAVRWYPGSPRLARMLLRPQDRLIACELHDQDVSALRREFRGDAQTGIHHMDGWAALKAFLPPRERRGLVLIDPPYEATDDYERLVQGLRLGHQRWPTGIFLLWHPIKERAAVWRLQQQLEDSGIRRILSADLTWSDGEDRLAGCGMVVVNPPWQLDKTLSDALPALHTALGMAAGGVRVDWIVPE